MYWTAIEVYVSIIVPSFPAVRSLLSHHFPGWFANDAPRGVIPLDRAAASHPYVRARSGKGSQTSQGSAETGSTLLSARWGWEGSNIDSGQNRAWVRGKGLVLGDGNRGAVLTEVVAGKRYKEHTNGSHESFWKNEGSAIIVSTSTETISRAKEQSWMEDRDW